MRSIDEEFKKAAEFHGHICPGLAIGYRVAKYAKEHYPRSKDEELVAIVENKSCSVDAIQEVLSCTYGKGNLITNDFGKQVFTFYSRNQDKAMRIYFKGSVFGEMDKLRQKFAKGELSEKEQQDFAALREQAVQKILTAPNEELLSVTHVGIQAPEKARIYPTLRCQECGEGFMEVLGRVANGKVVCKSCYEKMIC